ncbi:conjugative transfer signal peptidase TraF [Bradyrhizobium sp. USDA 4354]
MTGRLMMLAVTIGIAAALIATIVLGPLPLYIWNASPSVPIGLYRLLPADQFQVTELVAVQPPEPLATFLDLNGYLPIGVTMLKRVLALPGQSVCRSGLTISVDNVAVGEARDRDGRGRPLPKWQGCRVVGDGELFLMNWQSDDSLDGRYFGFLPASSVIGRAMPVWTWESDRAYSTCSPRHSLVRSIAGSFLRLDRCRQGWREPDRVLGAVGHARLCCRAADASSDRVRLCYFGPERISRPADD